MKLKDQIDIIINLKFFLIIFIFLICNKTFSSEKNFVVATVDRYPITYLDLKQKARLIHFLKTKNSNYKNLSKYFKLSLESLISQELLIKKAKEFNRNIIKLTEQDAYNYIIKRNKNSIDVFEKFLKKNNLTKSVVITNIQIEIIKKYLIGKMFEKEYDDYLKEISNERKKINNEIDLEQIKITINKKNANIINSIDDQISTLSNQGYSFKEISQFLSRNNLIKVNAGRSGWQNKSNFKSNTFEKLFQYPEGKIIKEKFNYNLNYLRIISKRENGKFSDREQIINLIRISYNNLKKNKINLNEFFTKNSKLQCKDIYKKLSEINDLKLSFQKVNLTNFSEKILLMIKNTNVKNLTDPIVFNRENLQFYICSKINIKKKAQSQNVYDDEKLMKKVEILTDKILKILKKDAIIDMKIKINEFN